MSAVPPRAPFDISASPARLSAGEAALLLTELDYGILAIASRLRVVTQTQLERLHPDVPGRTLRYRTQRLRRSGFLGRTRPYRDRGSAPSHYWPTNRADALLRGDPPPRRGERRAPNPLFLAHTAAVSELYVVLRTQGREAGLELGDFRREGEAREVFTDADGATRAIAPDARIALREPHGGVLLGHVELDLGTMPHGRLRSKLQRYVAHAEQRHLTADGQVVPALLLITTSAQRAETFLDTAERLRSTREAREELQIVACASARQLDGVLADRRWQIASGQPARTLRECLKS